MQNYLFLHNLQNIHEKSRTLKCGIFHNLVIIPLSKYIQFYTNDIPNPYVFASSDQSPPHRRGSEGVGNICVRGFAARTTAIGYPNTCNNLIRCKVVCSYLSLFPLPYFVEQCCEFGNLLRIFGSDIPALALVFRDAVELRLRRVAEFDRLAVFVSLLVFCISRE